MTGIRSATRDDVRSLVDIHREAFPGFILTRLGGRFLALLYQGFVDGPEGLTCVAIDQDAGGACRALGFAAGTTSPGEFFARLRRQRAIAFGVAALPALLRNPGMVAERLLAAVRYRGDGLPDLPGYCLLSSLAVLPRSGGRGIGSALVERFCAAARARGASGVYLTTDSNNNSTAHAFYRRNGFSARAQVTRSNGRKMTLYARDL